MTRYTLNLTFEVRSRERGGFEARCTQLPAIVVASDRQGLLRKIAEVLESIERALDALPEDERRTFLEARGAVPERPVESLQVPVRIGA